MTKGRYEVKATEGRWILHREFFDNATKAMEELESIQGQFPGATVEFRDHKPFDAR